MIKTHLSTSKNGSNRSFEDINQSLTAIRSRRERRGVHVNNSVASALAFDVPEQSCFVCGEAIIGDMNEFNLHLDRCLESSSQPAASASSSSTPKPKPKRQTKRKKKVGESEDEQSQDEEEEDIEIPQDIVEDDIDYSDLPAGAEVYEIGGRTRIRLVSMLENGYSGVLFDQNKKPSTQQDEEGDLDIEEDDTVAVNNSNGSSNFVLEALKHRIKEQEKMLINAPSCSKRAHREVALVIEALARPGTFSGCSLKVINETLAIAQQYQPSINGPQITSIKFDPSFNSQLTCNIERYCSQAMVPHLVLNRVSELSIGTIPSSVRHLTIGILDSPLQVGHIPSSVTHLTLIQYEKYLLPGVIPSSVTHLNFMIFNQPLQAGSIPASVTHLSVVIVGTIMN
eukprot:gene12020-14060_t